MQFKFVIPPGRWMLGGNLTAGPQADRAVLSYNDVEVQFPFVSTLVTGQYTHAPGFCDRYRRGSASPWTSSSTRARISAKFSAARPRPRRGGRGRRRPP